MSAGGELREGDVIHDWNLGARPAAPPAEEVLLVDESLRDGVQSPSVVDPPVAGKKRWGIASACIGGGQGIAAMVETT